MCSFRVHAESDTVFHCVYNHFLSFLVLEYIAQAVPLTHHWEDTYEEHQLGYERVVEKVGTSTEHCLIPMGAQDYKRVHECVAMIRSQKYRPVIRDILLALYACLPIAVPGAPVNYRSKN